MGILDIKVQSDSTNFKILSGYSEDNYNITKIHNQNLQNTLYLEPVTPTTAKNQHQVEQNQNT